MLTARIVACSCLAVLQYMHPESTAHEGYALVPPVVLELPRLQSLKLTVNSGQNVDLTPAAGVPDVNLVLTLAHYEQTPFNRWAAVRRYPAWAVAEGAAADSKVTKEVTRLPVLLADSKTQEEVLA